MASMCPPASATRAEPHVLVARGACAASERGFGLMELLIGVGLTVVILATTMVALNDGVRLNETARLVAEMQHNGRNWLNLMTRDLLQTGQGIPTGGIPIPSGGVTQIVRPGPGVLSYPIDTVVLPALTPGQALGPVVNGRLTDIITLLYADQTLHLDEYPLGAIAGDGSTMTVNAGTSITDADNGIAIGDLILFSNPLGHAVQQVTSLVSAQTVAFGAIDSMNLNQRTALAGTIIQLQDAPDSFPTTTARRIWMITYFVDATDTAAPKLMRIVNNGTLRPVALDVEDVQFTFDLVDGYANPADVDTPPIGNWPSQIRKVNLTLVTRSHDPLNRSSDPGDATDQYRYQSLTTQVALRSLSFLDRFQ